MKKILLSFLITAIAFSVSFSQKVSLTAVYDANYRAVKLNWNMIKSSYKTSYILLKSTDGITWMEAVKDRTPRYYDNDDLYFFNDRDYNNGKNFYRVKIADGSNNTVALSNIALVNTGAPIKNQPSVQATANTPAKTSTQNYGNNSSSWVIYPNPATDLLTLSYNGSNIIKGVVNVQITDARGITVIKFRSGSMYKKIEIPISKLTRGVYFISVSVLNEQMMNQRFIKQ